MKFLDKKSLGAFFLGFVFFPLLFAMLSFILAKAILPDLGKLLPPDLPYDKTISLDWNVTTLEGNVVNLGKTAEGKPLFINFWATGCLSCIKEMPSIAKLHETFGDRMVFACISTEAPKVLRDFAREKGFHVPLYKMYGEELPGLTMKVLPATFIISPKGKILVKHIGAADWSHENVVNYLTNFLDENKSKANHNRR
jgi:thiol-disulfide isomerase/thioredoxin